MGLLKPGCDREEDSKKGRAGNPKEWSLEKPFMPVSERVKPAAGPKTQAMQRDRATTTPRADVH